MKRMPPVLIIVTGLVMLTCAIVLMGDFFFSYLPDRQAEARRVHQRIADTIAIPVIDLLGRGNIDQIGQLLEQLIQRDSEIESIGIRRKSGELLVASHSHGTTWSEVIGDTSRQALVKIESDATNWGAIEFAFQKRPGGIIAFLGDHPGLTLLLTIITVGSLTFAMYMKRVLQQFDPNAVIPERVRAAFDAMTEGVVIIDDQGRIALANNKFREMGGELPKDLAAQALSSISWLCTRLPDREHDHPWLRSMREQRQIIGEELPFPDGATDSERIIVNCAPILDGTQRVRGCMVTFDDLTALHISNEKLERALTELHISRRDVEAKAADLARLASTDYLTGVLNRRSFTERADEAFDIAKQQRHQFACLMIDIDHFKVVNDTYGHSVGDSVIKATADILTATTGDGDMVGRYGGEEFCIALPNTGLTGATDMAERIRESIEQEVVRAVVELDGHVVTSSIGIAVYERHHQSMEALLESSDKALYDAKETGRNRVCVASSGAPVRA